MYAQQTHISHSGPVVQSGYYPANNIGQWNSTSGTSAIPAGGPWSHQMNPPSSGPLTDSTLPPGWVKQWDQRYQSWFFVNTFAQPPLSQWIHPTSASNQLLPGNSGVSSQLSAPYGCADFVAHQTNGHTGYMAGPVAAYSTALPNASHRVNALAGNIAHPNTQRIVKPSNSVIQNCKPAGSNILTAGISALGGLAMGAFINHELEEHQRHERERENEAYAAGVIQGEREFDCGKGRYGEIENGGNDSLDDDVRQDVDNTNGSWYDDQVTEDVEDSNDW